MPSEETHRLSPCECGAAVSLVPTYGGRGSGESTTYAVECPICGRMMDNLPGNCSGRQRDAAAEWNRSRKVKAKAA